MSDFVELAIIVVVIYASLIPLYMAGRLFRFRKAFFAVSVLLGLILVTHGAYRYWAALGDYLMGAEVEFVSALLLFSLVVYYSYMGRGSQHGA